MILSHLKDIKTKIEQKSINNVKLPFERPFYDKHAGRSRERIVCLYSCFTTQSCKNGSWKDTFVTDVRASANLFFLESMVPPLALLVDLH